MHKVRFWPPLSFILLLSCSSFASDVPQAKLAATLDASESLSAARREGISASVRFLDEESIAIGSCAYGKCTFSIVRWENGSLHGTKQTLETERDRGPSSGGARKLLDFNERKVPKMQRFVEILHTISTLGMSAPEDVNREVIQVVDKSSTRVCFEWKRDFPPTYEYPRSGALSPSGEFVAIVDGSALMMYQLPKSCDGPKVKIRGE